MMNNQPAAAENGRDGEIFLSIDVGEQHQGAQVRSSHLDQHWLQCHRGSKRDLENPVLNEHLVGGLHCHQLGVPEAGLQQVSPHQDTM